MEPSDFPESNRVLGAPPGMEASCDPLNVFVGPGPVVISCWKITKSELELLTRTGRIWLLISGNTMPPVCMQVDKPFEEK